MKKEETQNGDTGLNRQNIRMITEYLVTHEHDNINNNKSLTKRFRNKGTYIPVIIR